MALWLVNTVLLSVLRLCEPVGCSLLAGPQPHYALFHHQLQWLFTLMKVTSRVNLANEGFTIPP